MAGQRRRYGSDEQDTYPSTGEELTNPAGDPADNCDVF